MSEKKARRLQALRLGSGTHTHWLWSLLDRVTKLLALVLIAGVLVELGYLVAAFRDSGMHLLRGLEPPSPVAGPATVRPAPPPRIARHARTIPPVSGREPSEEDREAFSQAAYLAGGGGYPTHERVQERVREYYASQGIHDEEFVAFQAADEFDRGYQDALLEAYTSYTAGQPGAAVERLRAALEVQEPRHLVARLRLLEGLAAFAREAGDPATARRATTDAAAVREQLATAVRRALAPKLAARPEQARELDEVLASWKRDRETERRTLEGLAADGTSAELLGRLFQAAERK